MQQEITILDESLTAHKNIRKINVRNYIIFYVIDEEKSKAIVARIGHAFMDLEILNINLNIKQSKISSAWVYFLTKIQKNTKIYWLI